LGVSRNLSVKGNLGEPGNLPAAGGQPSAAARSRDAKEKQVNIPALDRRAVGDLKAISETGDVAGNRERDFPSLLRVFIALVSMHCAESQATYASRACRASVCSRSPSAALEKPTFSYSDSNKKSSSHMGFS